jgi:hypothetical protein
MTLTRNSHTRAAENKLLPWPRQQLSKLRRYTDTEDTNIILCLSTFQFTQCRDAGDPTVSLKGYSAEFSSRLLCLQFIIQNVLRNFIYLLQWIVSYPCETET